MTKINFLLSQFLDGRRKIDALGVMGDGLVAVPERKRARRFGRRQRCGQNEHNERRHAHGGSIAAAARIKEKGKIKKGK